MKGPGAQNAYETPCNGYAEPEGVASRRQARGSPKYEDIDPLPVNAAIKRDPDDSGCGEPQTKYHSLQREQVRARLCVCSCVRAPVFFEHICLPEYLIATFCCRRRRLKFDYGILVAVVF